MSRSSRYDTCSKRQLLHHHFAGATVTLRLTDDSLVSENAFFICRIQVSDVLQDPVVTEIRKNMRDGVGSVVVLDGIEVRRSSSHET